MSFSWVKLGIRRSLALYSVLLLGAEIIAILYTLLYCNFCSHDRALTSVREMSLGASQAECELVSSGFRDLSR